jgi:FkbM family methyltransferase
MIFYGYPPRPVERAFFKKLKTSSPMPALTEASIGVALDVLWRYWLPKTSLNNWPVGFADPGPGETVLECGPFLGYFAMRAAEQVGRQGRIVAVEAHPENFLLLKKNIEENQLTQVTVKNCAIWNSQTEVQFHREDKQLGSVCPDVISARTAVAVRGETIDNIVDQYRLPKVDLVRIQINGAEYEALEGMAQTLKQRPRLAVTSKYLKASPSREPMETRLRSMGYHVERQESTYFAF